MKKSSISVEPKVWRYDLSDGWFVLAGKTSFDNELLSLQFSRPEDYWFHSAECPGSHVILRHMDDTIKTPDNAILKCAAAIAGWHSKQRANGMVKVDMTLAKYVSKPPHSPEGTVSISHVKTIKVAPGLPRPLET